MPLDITIQVTSALDRGMHEAYLAEHSDIGLLLVFAYGTVLCQKREKVERRLYIPQRLLAEPLRSF
jgi:hypothetical protein